MTNRNTKGRTARKAASKKAPKKPVKKPSLADIQHFHGLTAEYLIDWRKELSTQLDQIQRDIEQVRTLAHQTRTNSRANTVILNKTLAGVDLLKSGSSFMQEVEQHKAATEEQGLEEWNSVILTEEVACELTKLKMPVFNDTALDAWRHSSVVWKNGKLFGCAYNVSQFPPADFLARARVTAKKLGLVLEEPKAEPWVPKVGDWVVCDKVQKGPSPGWAKPFMDDLIGIPMKVVERERAYAVRACSFLWADEWLRPATQEEIAEAEGEWKLKKLVRGCRVETPDGRGIYLGRDGSEDGREHIVSPDNSDSFWVSRYDLDQLTPLT